MALHKRLRADLSGAALKKSVLATISQQPLTVYPAAAALVTGAYAVAFGGGLVTTAVIGAGVAFTSINWLWEYFGRSDVHANAIVKRYREELEMQREQALSQLLTELIELEDRQASRQLALFQEKYRNFVAILNRKFNADELTYNRYLTIAEQVYLAGLDNLESTALAIRSVSTIDVHYIEAELKRLAASKKETDHTRRAELQARLNLRGQQLDRAAQLLAVNEQALTQLDQVTARLASIDTAQGRAEVDLEAAISELRRLVLNTDQYSNS